MGKVIVGNFSGKKFVQKKSVSNRVKNKLPKILVVAREVFCKVVSVMADLLFYLLLWLRTPIVGIFSFVTVLTFVAWLFLLVTGRPSALWVGVASFLSFMAMVAYDRLIQRVGATTVQRNTHD